MSRSHPTRKSPTIFVLWKPSAPNEPGWESPWGYGRPGWHLECSAMSWKYLGEVFDIHGGGIDLVFPHHENEIAQTCSAFGHKTMANYWLHNGFLQVEGQKNVEEPRQFPHHPPGAEGLAGRSRALQHAQGALSSADRLDASSLDESQRELDKFYPLAKQFAVSEATLAPEFLAPLEDDPTRLRRSPYCAGFIARRRRAMSALAGTRFASSGHFLGLFQSELSDWNPAPTSSTKAMSKPDRARARRAPGEGLGRIRPPPRRIDRPRHRAEGQQGRHDELGGEAMNRLASPLSEKVAPTLSLRERVSPEATGEGLLSFKARKRRPRERARAMSAARRISSITQSSRSFTSSLVKRSSRKP